MPDPRSYPDPAAAPPEAARLHGAAAASLAAESGLDAAARDAEIGAALDALLAQPTGAPLAELFASAPSAAIYRHLWRVLAERERAGAPDPAQLVRLFALPVIVVAGRDAPSADPATLDGVLADPAALAAILREHGALAGHASLALANALVAADALEFDRLPALLAWRSPDAVPAAARALAPAPLRVAAGTERVHLRFLIGTTLAAPGTDPFRDATVGQWGMPLAKALAAALTVPGVTVLTMPRAPQPLATALWQGRLAQRETSALLFASNAIRKLRAATGEPSAVISVHRVDEPAGGGEVRLSLSSPLDPRAAEGYRCPLLPLDRVEDVVQMLATLVADCRVADLRVLPGIHGDRDPATGLALLFKAADLPPAPAVH